MARPSGFKEHSMWGSVYAGAVGVFFLTGMKLDSSSIVFAEGKDLGTVVILMAVAWLGSIMPDMDSSRSLARKVMFVVFLLVFSVGSTNVGALIEVQQQYNVTNPNSLYSILIVVVAMPVFQVITDSILKHRGITHSITGVFLSGAILMALLNILMPLDAIYVVIAFIVGSGGNLVHLVVDYVYGLIPSKGNKGEKEGNMNHTLFVFGGSNNVEFLYFTLLTLGVLLISNSINEFPVIKL